MDFVLRDVPTEIHAEIKRLTKRNDTSLQQEYRKALKNWFELRQRGVITN